MFSWIVLSVGILSILLGVIFNPWGLHVLFPSADLSKYKILTRMFLFFDIVFISFGILLIYFWKNRRVLANLALCLFSILICLAACEVVLRFVEHRNQKLTEIPINIQNPNQTGSYRLKPNYSQTVQMNPKQIVIQTNSHGMRWREVSLAKSENKKRIAFAGDSFTFGCWATSIEKTFVGVVDALNAEKFDVLNFGVSGYGLDDMQLQIEEEIFKFSPDVLVLNIFTGNDFRDTFLGLNKYDISQGLAELSEENIRAKIPEEFRATFNSNGMKAFVSQHLYTYQFLKKAVKNFSQMQHKNGNGSEVISNFETSQAFNSYAVWSLKKYPDVAVLAKDRFLKVLEEIYEQCKIRDIKLIIVSIPFKEQVFARDMTGVLYDLNYPQKYIEDFARSHSVGYLDLLLPLRSFVREKNPDIYFPNDGHFNDAGHAFVGERISEFLRNYFTLGTASSGNPEIWESKRLTQDICRS